MYNITKAEATPHCDFAPIYSHSQIVSLHLILDTSMNRISAAIHCEQNECFQFELIRN